VETELAIRGVGQRLYNHLAETFQPPQGPLGSQESLVSANWAPIPIENSKPLQQNVYKTQRHDPPGFEDATPVSIYPSGLRDYGPFGRFVLNTPNTGVRIYGPVQVLERASQAPKRPGVTILISGAGGDHTSLGEGPLQLHRKGRQVRILTIPGYGENEPESILRTPSKTLEKNWYTALSATVKKIMGENPEGPVILGGFSQGSAMAIRVFKGLSPAEQNRVQGLILGAPAFAFTALETKSSLVNWIKRYLYVPYQALMNKTRQRKVPDRLAPELRKDFYVKTKRPWRGEYAAVLSGEAARRDLATIKNPPPTLVIHGGRSDPTVSYKAAELVRQAFGKQAEFLNLEGEDSGHYVFVGEGRQRVFNRVIEFLERTAPRPETTKEAWRVQQHNRDGISEAIGQIMHGQFPEGEEAHLSESFKIRGPNDRDCSLYCNIHFNPDGTIDFNRFNILSVGRVPEPTSVSGILVELRPYPPENDITRRHYIPYRILKPNGDVERFQRQNWYEYWFQSEHFTQVRRIIDENPVLGLEIWKRDKRNDLPALSNSAEAPILTWPRPSGFKYGETIPDQDIHMALKLREDIATPVGSYPAQNIRAVSFVNLLRPFWDPIEFEGPGVESRFTTNPDHGLSFQTRISDPKRIRPIGLLATNTQFYLRRNGQAYEIRQGDVLREPRMIRKAFNWLLGPALHPTRINDGSPLGLKWSPLNSGDKIRFGKSELIWTEPTL
jgi:alpha-beta hydrolase superfamily lysophospholipase